MSEMQDKFYAGVERASKTVAKHLEVIDDIKKQADKDPELWATGIVEVVPDCLKKMRLTGLKTFGIDLADAEAIRNYEASSVAEWQWITRSATCYLLYDAFLRLVHRYFQDTNLLGVQSAQAVCEAYIAASKQYLCAAVLDLYELQQQLPEEGFPREELAKLLGGIVNARPRLKGWYRDRKQLRERLAEGGEEPHKQLTIDGTAEALDVFYEMMQSDSTDLSFEAFEDLSNEVRRRIRRIGAKESVAEGRLGEINERNEPEDEGSSPEEVYESALTSEWLHGLADNAGLSRQERESFLALGGMTSLEAAEKFGRSANQVRQENLRALKKLRRAAGL